MKPLTKTVVSRGGGIAGRFEKGGDAPEARRSKRTNQPETPPAASPQKPAAGDPLDYVTPPRPMRKVRAHIIKKPKVANAPHVANKRRYDKWREANPELYKERQRGYQQNYRARKRTEKERE